MSHVELNNPSFSQTQISQLGLAQFFEKGNHKIMFHCIPIELLALIEYFSLYTGLRKLCARGILDRTRKIMHVIFI